jgi:hypothetical protein
MTAADRQHLAIRQTHKVVVLPSDHHVADGLPHRVAGAAEDHGGSDRLVLRNGNAACLENLALVAIEHHRRGVSQR